MLLKFCNEGLEELVIAETLRSRRYPLCVIHGQLRQNALQLIHLTLTLLHGLNQVVWVDRLLFEQVLNANKIALERGHLVHLVL